MCALRPGGKLKSFRYPRIVKPPLLAQIADQSACYQPFVNFWKKIVFDQIQCYFTTNKLTTEFQHPYREGHSTSTALTQMTDDWLRHKMIVGAVLLDFSVAFDIIDHSLLLEKHVLWLHTPCYNVDKELLV